MASGPRRAFSTPTPITPGTPIPRGPQQAALVSCTVAGTITLKLPGGDMLISVPVGVTYLQDIEIIGVTAGTATATVFALS